MSANSGVLSPPKTPEHRDGSPDEEETLATRTKELSENKTASKCVRVLTVSTYVLSVSMAAILLSLYYVFLWDPQPPLQPQQANPTHAPRHPRQPLSPMRLRSLPGDYAPREGFHHHLDASTELPVTETNGHSDALEEAATFPFQPENPFTDSNTTENAELSTFTSSYNDTDVESTPLYAPQKRAADYNKLSNSLLITRISDSLHSNKRRSINYT